MEEWFTKEIIDQDTCILSEYRHWEETHCYLLQGQERSLLIDTGLGICSIYDQVRILTDQPVTAVATHVHWDHIGGHQYFPDFYAHEAELSWLQGSFPLTVEQVRRMVADRCRLPQNYRLEGYTLFQGVPTRLLQDGDWIDLGGRSLQVLHTPGHSPAICASGSQSGAISLPEIWSIWARYSPTILPQIQLPILPLWKR